MAITTMVRFNNMRELSNFSIELEHSSWKIEKEYLKDRAIYYSKMKLFKDLKSLFLTNDISIFPLKDEEVITWMDTLSLLKKLMTLLFQKGVRTDDITILMEYPLVFGNHMRTDYVLIYDRLIVVLEFGMFNQDERRSEERYTKKLQESISYRQLLSNLLNHKIDIVNYVMIYKPEYSRIHNKYFDDHIKYNLSELDKLSNFLKHLIKIQDESLPLVQLSRLNALK